MVKLLCPEDLNQLQIEPGSSNGAKSEIQLHVYLATMHVDTQLQTHNQPTLVYTLLILASYYPSP